jgi:hypothetical protein
VVMSTITQLAGPSACLPTNPRAVELLRAVGGVRAACGVNDHAAESRWSACLALLLMQHAEAAGFAIWDDTAAGTAQRRAGHDAWSIARDVLLGHADGPGPGVDDLFALVALYTAEEVEPRPADRGPWVIGTSTPAR